LIGTWFGIATHPATIILLSNTTNPHAYGRELDTGSKYSSFCSNGPNFNISETWGLDSYWPCNIEVSIGASLHLVVANPIEATKLQYGLPTFTQLSNYTHNKTNWVFYTDPRSNANLDFMTSTPALATQCVAMTKRCLQNIDSDHKGLFECTPGFRGNWSAPWPYKMTNQTVGADYGTGSTTGIAFAFDAALSSTPPLVTTGIYQQH
jgi:hypothetical protein